MRTPCSDKEADDVQRVPDDQRGSFLPALGSNRKHPGSLKLADIRYVNLIQRTEAGAGVVPRWHHPLLRVLGKRGEIVGPSGGTARQGGECQREKEHPSPHTVLQTRKAPRPVFLPLASGRAGPDAAQRQMREPNRRSAAIRRAPTSLEGRQAVDPEATSRPHAAVVNSCTENRGTAAKSQQSAEQRHLHAAREERTRNASGPLELKTAIHNTSAAAMVVACINQ